MSAELNQIANYFGLLNHYLSPSGGIQFFHVLASFFMFSDKKNNQT